jgi:sialic acid synthase SpsE
MSKIHIIAEAGTNHNGSTQKAFNLIDIAKRCGADSVKFQIINTWGLYLPGKYEYGHYNIDDVIKIRLSTELPDEEYRKIADYAMKKGILFSASVFDSKGLKLLASLNPPYIKIASCDLNNIRFLREVASYGKKIILSTGMSSLEDIELTINELYKINFTNIVLLHCVSVYPAKLEETNISFIKVLKNHFNLEVGFSDHTQTSHAACMAVALGATWIEKHFTESKKQVGLDHAYALEEDELKSFINDIRAAEIAIQEKDSKISENEYYTRKRARRSLYASKDLAAGHTISDEDILIVRPESFMQANEYDFLIGKKLNTSIQKYQPFKKEYVS